MIMERTQAEIDEDRSAMAQAIVDGQRLENIDDAKRFARAWIVTAAQHATNEAYYHDRRDALLRLLVELRPHLTAWDIGSNLLARVDEQVRDAGFLLEPVAERENSNAESK
jgi:hypothetical protein